MIVLYHKDCPDGFCAAWLLSKIYPDAKFIPCQYGEQVPQHCLNEDIIIVDFSFKRDILLQIKQLNKSLLVFDHHKTAQADCEGLDFCTFDINKCGSRLIYNRYLDELFYYKRIVDWVEDHDLWKHEVCNERCAVIQSLPYEFNIWDELHETKSMDIDFQGQGILRYQQKSIDLHLKRVHYAWLGNQLTPTINCSDRSIISKLLHILLEQKSDALFVASYYKDDKSTTWSLRSRTGSDMDVSSVAQMYGGGGHKHAAGFVWRNDQSLISLKQ